jgi:hypothetical protein
MSKPLRKAWLLALAAAFTGLSAGAASAAPAQCFSSSKAYKIQPLLGGPAIQDGWAARGDDFGLCVHHAEAADKKLHARYPDSQYQLSLVATIGCHSPCSG